MIFPLEFFRSISPKLLVQQQQAKEYSEQKVADFIKTRVKELENQKNLEFRREENIQK